MKNLFISIDNGVNNSYMTILDKKQSVAIWYAINKFLNIILLKFIFSDSLSNVICLVFYTFVTGHMTWHVTFFIKAAEKIIIFLNWRILSIELRLLWTLISNNIYFLFSVLLVLCILSGLVGVAYLGFDPLVRSLVLKKLVLSNTSDTFHIWEDPPISPHLKVCDNSVHIGIAVMLHFSTGYINDQSKIFN